MTLKIGITGGIGSGKTTVAKIFEVLGIPVFYADSEAKRIMNENEELRKKIIENFGEQSYTNNKLNRKYISEIVFNDTYKLDLLNSIVHPITIAAADEWMLSQNTPYVLKEAALMFESSAASHLDYVIGVYAPQHLRIQRTTQRDNITRQEVLQRMNRQIDEEIKMRLCNFIIVNDEQQLVIPQVISLHEQLKKLAKEK